MKPQYVINETTKTAYRVTPNGMFWEAYKVVKDLIALGRAEEVASCRVH